MTENKPDIIGSCVWIDPRITFGNNVTIGHGSCIGFPEEGETECKIMDNVSIGAFCVISMGAVLEKNVKLEHYCRVDKAIIGENAQLLYGARVHYNAKIGHDSCIGGNVPDRTIIGNNVKHFGRLVHIPRGGPWDDTEDPSPVIEDDVFIGANAIVIGGVKIGKKAIIGANALVIGDDTVIGESSKIAPMELVKQSIPPYTRYSNGKCIPLNEK